jgi:hypothetical protein
VEDEDRVVAQPGDVPDVVALGAHQLLDLIGVNEIGHGSS